MARYKGRPSAQTIVRDFPHVVEIRMAVGGLGKRIDTMHEFHSRRGIRFVQSIRSVGRVQVSGAIP